MSNFPSNQVMLSLAIKYYLLVTILAFSTIQAASTYAGFSGLTLFKRPLHNYLLAVILSIPCLAGFLTWNWYNPTGIIEGAQQFYFFMLGLITAIGSTLVISSVVNHSRFEVNNIGNRTGFEALKEQTFFQVIRSRLQNFSWRSLK
jgi:hypothetical protein